MAQLNVKDKAFRSNDFISNENVSSKILNQVELAFKRGVNFLFSIIFSWKEMKKL